jgi:hypothetical protein
MRRQEPIRSHDRSGRRNVAAAEPAAAGADAII